MKLKQIEFPKIYAVGMDSRDVADVADVAKRTYAELNAEDNIAHVRYKGGHALTQVLLTYTIERSYN